MIVPGASFGMLCQVELEVILYYLAKAFVFVCFDIVVGSLKRFGVQSLVAIESAVGVLGWPILGVCGLAWAELGKRSQLPVIVFSVLEMSELVEVLFFLAMCYSSRSFSSSSNILLRIKLG